MYTAYASAIVLQQLRPYDYWNGVGNASVTVTNPLWTTCNDNGVTFRNQTTIWLSNVSTLGSVTAGLLVLSAPVDINDTARYRLVPTFSSDSSTVISETTTALANIVISAGFRISSTVNNTELNSLGFDKKHIEGFAAYGYRNTGITDWLSNVVLSVYAIIALFHIACLFGGHGSSESWETIEELTALAQKLRPVPNTLSNTCAGTKVERTFRPNMRVRVVRCNTEELEQNEQGQPAYKVVLRSY
ncbi:hypothetical protein K469DRAFT_690563 [Zopfia rhizophila CBS 207.26]|uniref:Uncharacterized protein n=1 Tax=Zopfia rhizophila CBS 207.26 TaxID=1314779 RepID=A0A6A6DUW5_9PEZI|nr:hypothetical protein K469DRAFT_690563 [Zopfia rhizophila CBS 207.26]